MANMSVETMRSQSGQRLFEPPNSMRMSDYLDEVTGGRVTNGKLRHVFGINANQIDQALRLIKSRPTINERVALLAELQNRMLEQQRIRWKPYKSNKSVEDLITTFIIEDIFGLKQRGPSDKIQNEFKDRIKQSIKLKLNKRENRYFSVLLFLHEIFNAKNGDELIRVLAKQGLGGLGVWMKNNSKFVDKLKRVKAPSSRVRGRLGKAIATSLLYSKKIPIGWSKLRGHPALLAIEIVVTPSVTPTPQREWQNHFDILYGKVVAAGSITVFDDIVLDTRGDVWRYRIAPAVVLRRYEDRGGGSGSSQSTDSGASTGSKGPEIDRLR